MPLKICKGIMMFVQGGNTLRLIFVQVLINYVTGEVAGSLGFSVCFWQMDQANFPIFIIYHFHTGYFYLVEPTVKLPCAFFSLYLALSLVSLLLWAPSSSLYHCQQGRGLFRRLRPVCSLGHTYSKDVYNWVLAL